MMLNILAVGDVVGEGGLDILSRRLPELREEVGAHFVVVNGENASGQRQSLMQCLPSHL